MQAGRAIQSLDLLQGPPIRPPQLLEVHFLKKGASESMWVYGQDLTRPDPRKLSRASVVVETQGLPFWLFKGGFKVSSGTVEWFNSQFWY